MGTHFSAVYDRFLNKITDDMYIELTPEDTIKDLQKLLVNAIPEFEFPRCNLYDYIIKVETVEEREVQPDDFMIGILWDEMEDGIEPHPLAVIERSTFEQELTEEEINILAILMMKGWLQRQITSIENIRMKYTGSDFKMTSQANHLAKLLNLQEECRRQDHHYQRLYKRRRTTSSGIYRSNWDIFGPGK